MQVNTQTRTQTVDSWLRSFQLLHQRLDSAQSGLIETCSDRRGRWNLTHTLPLMHFVNFNLAQAKKHNNLCLHGQRRLGKELINVPYVLSYLPTLYIVCAVNWHPPISKVCLKSIKCHHHTGKELFAKTHFKISFCSFLFPPVVDT